MSTLQTNAQKISVSEPKPKYKGKTGAKIFHEMLIQQHKVEVMFGYPGGAILPVFDQLYKTPAKFILNRHEQGSRPLRRRLRPRHRQARRLHRHQRPRRDQHRHAAGHRADGFSIPILVFSGQVATKVIGNDAFQEADVTGITRPCTKWNYLVKDVRELPRVINEAFIDRHQRPARAGAGRSAQGRDHRHLHRRSGRHAAPAHRRKRKTRRHPCRACQAGAGRRRTDQPQRKAGALRRRRRDHQRRLATRCARSPTRATSPAPPRCWAWARSTSTIPRPCYMLGMHGSAFANYAVQECDCLIAVGARFDDRVTGNLATFAPQRQDHPHRHRSQLASARTSMWIAP